MTERSAVQAGTPSLVTSAVQAGTPSLVTSGVQQRASDLERSAVPKGTYGMIAVDLDGTLLDSRGQVHARDAEALAELRARGVPLTILTGRLYSGTRHVAEAISVRGPVGCADGSHLVDAVTGRDILHAGIVGEAAARLRAVVERVRPITFVFAHDQIVHDALGAEHVPYVQTWSRDVVHVERVTEHPHWGDARGLTAVISIADADAIASAREELERTVGDAVSVVAFPLRRTEHQGSWALIVRAAGHSKGTALEYVARHHGLAASEVVAVGDWLNDLPMFAAAGRSFAMAHAPEIVLEAASDRLVASASTGGGVAEAAERAGLL